VLPFSIYLIQALFTVVVVICSYVAHRYYSFRGGHPRDAGDAGLYDPGPVSRE
jgi:hypothetical protein